MQLPIQQYMTHARSLRRKFLYGAPHKYSSICHNFLGRVSILVGTTQPRTCSLCLCQCLPNVQWPFPSANLNYASKQTLASTIIKHYSYLFLPPCRVSRIRLQSYIQLRTPHTFEASGPVSNYSTIVITIHLATVNPILGCLAHFLLPGNYGSK